MQMLLQFTMNTVKVAEEIVQTLTDVELPAWKRRQQLSCIGSPINASLDDLQSWYERHWPFMLRRRLRRDDAAPAGSQPSRKCSWNCANSFRNFSSRTGSTTAQRSHSSLLPWRRSKKLPPPCASSCFKGETLKPFVWISEARCVRLICRGVSAALWWLRNSRSCPV